MRNFGTWRKRIRIVILAVLAADVLLFWFNWQVVGAAPEQQQIQRDRLRQLHQQWGDDVRRVADIRARLTQTERDCNTFFEERFLSEEVGSSAVVADLTAIASSAGLQTRSVTYKSQEREKRNVMEVAITASVEGSYSSITKFIRGLERSERFYLMEHLALASAQGGDLKLNLQLKTYYRLNRS